jgi:hypothetical protein
LLGLLLLLVLVGAAATLSVAVGSRGIGLGAVWQALTDPGVPTEETVIVRELRVPRTALGLMAGLALGVAGALAQGHTRNPLGDPGLLGVTAGASLGVVLAIHLLGVGTPAGYVWFAFAGALLGTVLVFSLGSAGRGGATPVTLALAGAALSALFYALVRAVLVSDTDSLDAFRFWVVGALAGRGADVAWQVAPFIAAGLVLALVNASASGCGWPARSAWPRSPCSAARRRRPAVPSPSSAWWCRTSSGCSPAPRTAGWSPAPACWGPPCCWSPTWSGASSSAPASCRSASCWPCSGRRSSSR